MKKGKIPRNSGQERRTEFMKLLDRLKDKYSTWQVWDDFIYFSAASLSQPCRWVQERENEYLRRIGRYPKELQQLFPQMLVEITMAFEQEGFADILGEIYMNLELNNHWRGQYFTPYNIALMMAKMSASNPSEAIEKNGFISVGDLCCGSGVMLIAFAHNCFDNKVDYQRDVLFVGQDVDPVVARMCYISLSLLGCPGYVVIGNSFTQPVSGGILSPIPSDGSEILYTPMFFKEIWCYRRVFDNQTNRMV